MLSLESPHFVDSNDYTQHTLYLYFMEDLNAIPIMPPDLMLYLTLSCSFTICNKFYGPKGV